jgi:hypothetical protein
MLTGLVFNEGVKALERRKRVVAKRPLHHRADVAGKRCNASSTHRRNRHRSRGELNEASGEAKAFVCKPQQILGAVIASEPQLLTVHTEP